MRLWHKNLINVLPNAQIKGQWNEINAIIGSISKFGSPRHGLVNYIMAYDSSHFHRYCLLVLEEIQKRNKRETLKYNPRKSIEKINTFFQDNQWVGIDTDSLFEDHHHDEYFVICYYNLLEKYRAKLIPDNEWQIIEAMYRQTNQKT